MLATGRLALPLTRTFSFSILVGLSRETCNCRRLTPPLASVRRAQASSARPCRVAAVIDQLHDQLPSLGQSELAINRTACALGHDAPNGRAI